MTKAILTRVRALQPGSKALGITPGIGIARMTGTVLSSA